MFPMKGPPKADKKGKKVNTAQMAKALRKPRQMKDDPDVDALEEATQRGGYSRGHGIGSG